MLLFSCAWAFCAVALCGCSDPAQILMRNPRTDNVVVCRHELFTMSTTECAEKLEREGWLRIR
ncbi:MAG: hypothetical protein DMD83_14790 [Candidatus Rokuibacteriota bacterium]|nr:MAG: hypothetical protein DMD83_14790 [Candidatus Rokubacteria bacterium]